MRHGLTRVPLILDVRGNSLDDGPGIRSVVFFKGCPLSCVWCHNPECRNADAELSYDAELCISCNACLDACPQQALSRNNPEFVDRVRCVRCFTCTKVCPSGALSVAGREMSVDEILQRIVCDKPFFDSSAGGVTLSGGEPTLFMVFAASLAQALKREGIHVLLETCGLFDYDDFMKRLFPHLNAIYYDIKLIDSEAHRRYCGAPNEKILHNFSRLVKTIRGIKKKSVYILPRTPLIPGITDTDENLAGIASFLRRCGIARASLLPYNPLWHKKCVKLGMDNYLSSLPCMQEWMQKEAIERCRNIFLDAGIEV